jgi:hypothetical protein
MSLEEYTHGIVNDLFQCKPINGGLDFPCIMCVHSQGEPDDYPCKFCGHNENSTEFFHCALCCNPVEGNMATAGLYLAKNTPAEIGPMCKTCWNTIVDDATS